MDQPRRSSNFLAGAVFLVLMLTLAGCGISDDAAELQASDGKTSTSGNETSTTATPSMRPPQSLCERISHEAVEGASRLELDPGNPTEENGYPECNWRARGRDIAVSIQLEEAISEADMLEWAGTEAEEIPDLGDYAVWSTLGRVRVLTDEGMFSAIIFNFELSDVQMKDAAVEILRTVMDTTEVPDTTTTTTTTEVPEATGLCARVSFETVEDIAGEPIEPGRAEPYDDEGVTCDFRTVTEGSIVSLELFKDFPPSIVEGYQESQIAGQKAWSKPDIYFLYVETPEGVLRVNVSNYELTTAEFEEAATTLIEEFLASA